MHTYVVGVGLLADSHYETRLAYSCRAPQAGLKVSSQLSQG